MIRYIDLGYQIYPHSESEKCTQFAWWNTIKDKFYCLNGNQGWDTWRDFEDDFWCEYDYLTDDGVLVDKLREILERFKGLFLKEKEKK